MLFRQTLYLLTCACFVPFLSAEDANPDVDVVVLSLDEVLDQALLHNLGLFVQRYTPANAAETIVSAKAGFDPEFFSNVRLSKRRSAAIDSTLDSAVPTSENRRAGVGVTKQLSTGASVTVDSGLSRSASNNNAARNPDYASDIGLSFRQPILKDSGFKVNLAPIARARAQFDQSLFNLRSQILDLILDTEIAYWNLSYARASLALIASSIELANNLLEENEERERLGLVTPLEVLQARTELVNQQEDLIQAERAIEEAQDRLRQLMGVDSFVEHPDREISVSSLPEKITQPASINAVVDQALLVDMDAAAQERQVEVQRINRMLAKDDARFDLDLIGGVNYLGRDTVGQDAYMGAYNADGYDWNIGVELRIPIGQRDAKAQLRQADRNLEREKVRLYALKQDKALAARSAWRAVYAGKKRIDVTSQSLALNEQSFEQERARYGSGLTAYRQVLEAQRDYDRARSNYLSAIIETLRARVRLGRVDGSILDRNGYTWETLDRLATAPDVESHPLLNDSL